MKDCEQNPVSSTELAEYSGLSDFLLRAPDGLKKRVFFAAAQKANEDQMKIFKQAQGVEV